MLCLYPTATVALGLDVDMLAIFHWSFQNFTGSFFFFTLQFFNLLRFWPANQHKFHQRTPLSKSKDFHMGSASGKQRLKIKGSEVTIFILPTSSLPDCTGQLFPSTKGHSSSQAMLPLQLLSGSSLPLPGDRPTGSIGFLLLLAHPLTLNHPLLVS